jgi:hypothetical protein
LSAAAGFGFDHNKFGVFSTFSAFLEMTLSELTMARLNHCNLLCHFSHSGVDEMADNTCHFGIGGMLFDNGLMDAPSYMYFPADPAQMRMSNESSLIWELEQSSPPVQRYLGS